MIRISRTAEPAILATSSSSTRYTLPQVVAELFEMHRGKCCYCERNIYGATQGKHVEHFQPQVLREDLRNEWTNLLLACSDCNGAKGGHFPKSECGEPLVIDPSNAALDPEDHIEFNVEKDRIVRWHVFAKQRDFSKKGSCTIELIGLNRVHLIQDRGDRLDHIWQFYRELVTEIARLRKGTGDLHRLDYARQRLREFASDGCNFAGVARSFARAKRLHRYGV